MPKFSTDKTELIIGVLLLLLLLLVINPGHIWMPTMLAMTFSVLLLVVFGMLAVFVWRERAADEREQLHTLLVGHAAFLIGAGVLTIGLLTQSLSHSTDPWLALALGAMILTKCVGLVWARWKQ